MRSSGLARFFFLAIAVFVSSCTNGRWGSVSDPPPTPILSRPLGWAVINVSYSQVFDIPNSSGVVLGYYRKAAIVSVTERKKEILKDSVVSWLKNEGNEPGWIKESEIMLFDSSEKALTAAKTVVK